MVVAVAASVWIGGAVAACVLFQLLWHCGRRLLCVALPWCLAHTHHRLRPFLCACEQKSECQTCGKELARCAGHFGYVKLALPVFHIGYMKATLDILHNICKTCSRVLLNEAEIMRCVCAAAP